MAGTWAYNPTTNALTVTGATAGAPAGIVDAWNYDKATARTLKAATASPFTASLDTAVKPAEQLAQKLSIVITNFSVAGTVQLTGTDAWGNAITETLNITGNGTVVSTLYYATIGANGVVALGTFTAAITQPRLGVVWKQGANQYRLDCLLVFGDGATATYFTDTLKQIYFSNFYAYGANVMSSTAAAVVTFGTIINLAQKSTKDGCDFVVDNTGGTRFYIGGAQINFYSCHFKTVSASDAWLNGAARLWNCELNYLATRFLENCDLTGTTFINSAGSGALLNIGAGNTYVNNKAMGCSTIVRGDGSPVGSPFVGLYSRNHTYVASYINVRTAWTFVNPDFDTWAFFWNTTSASAKAYRQYTFDLTTDPGATVTLKDKDNVQLFSVTADAVTGAIAQQTVTYGTYDPAHGDVMQPCGPFTLQITAAGKMPYTASLAVDAKTNLFITLRAQLAGTAAVADVLTGKTFYAADADSQLIGAATLKGHTKILTKIVEKEKEVRLPSALEAPALELVENLLQQNIDRKKRQKS